MGDVTIHGIDDDLKRRLELRAAANGRSLDEELRAALELMASGGDRTDMAARISSVAAMPDEVREAHPSRPITKKEREAKIQRVVALGRTPDKPFDLKKESDELWNFID